MNKALKVFLLVGAFFALTAATVNYAKWGQAPEGMLSNNVSFERNFAWPMRALTIMPVSADISVILDRNSTAVNDTIQVFAGDAWTTPAGVGIRYFKVIRPTATKVWNAWYR